MRVYHTTQIFHRQVATAQIQIRLPLTRMFRRMCAKGIDILRRRRLLLPPPTTTTITVAKRSISTAEKDIVTNVQHFEIYVSNRLSHSVLLKVRPL